MRRKTRKTGTLRGLGVAVGLAAVLAAPALASAQQGAPNFLGLKERLPLPVEILLLLSILSFIPAILVMFTSFTRIVVVLGFVRQATGAAQTPPNPVLVGLALFLTIFIMSPTFERIHQEALKPYLAREISYEEAVTRAAAPLRRFMLAQVRQKDLALFVRVSGEEPPARPEEVRMTVLVPAFVIGELRRAFEIGFLIYMPFLIIDMVVASIMLSMGMMMVPPVMISLPFKLLLFVLVDGWNLLIGSLVASFG